jgi:hypothetical protein
MDEMVACLRRMPSGKAPGIDGVPAEVLKLAVPPIVPAGQPAPPASEFALALLRVCNAVFAGDARTDGIDTWVSCLMVPLAKKGDLTIADNFRGIGMQCTVCKLVASMVLCRMETAIEQADVLGRSQAGFRRKEECVAQAAALLEMCQRRRRAGLSTYLVFVDFQKAYDSVPHEALLAKLEHMGVRGRVLEYLRRLHAEARACVKLAGRLAAEVFRVLRGVIQGAPLSPLLFDLFMVDMSRSFRGVAVPGLAQGELVTDLKFADDVAIPCDSLESVRATLVQLVLWAGYNGMRVNGSKCGAMLIYPVVRDGDAEGESARERAVAEMAAVRWLRVGHQPADNIPIVQSYTYLGLDFNNELDMDRLVSARAEKARERLASVGPLLRDPLLPVEQKLMALKAYLLPVINYGGELLGMNATRVAPLQCVQNRALRMVYGASRSTSVVALHWEARLHHVATNMAAARARALYKWPSLRTWIARLLAAPARARGRRTWSESGRAWLKTRGLLEVLQLQGERAVRQRVLEDRAGRLRARGGLQRPAAVRAFAQYELFRTCGEQRALQKHGVVRRLGLHNLAMSLVLLMRVGAFPTGRALAIRGLADVVCAQRCLFCGKRVRRDGVLVGETLSHYVLSCSAWAKERARFLAPVMRIAGVAAWRQVPAKSRDLLHILLGGRVSRHHAPSLLVMPGRRNRAAANIGGGGGAANAGAVGVAVGGAEAGVDAIIGAANAVVGDGHDAKVDDAAGANAGDVDIAGAEPAPVVAAAAGGVAAAGAVPKAVFLNWLAAMTRFVMSTWTRRCRLLPLSPSRHHGMAALVGAEARGA